MVSQTTKKPYQIHVTIYILDTSTEEVGLSSIDL